MTRPLAFLPPLLLWLAAGSAGADCLTRADLVEGIAITQQDGRRALARETGAGVEVAETLAPGRTGSFATRLWTDGAWLAEERSRYADRPAPEGAVMVGGDGETRETLTLRRRGRAPEAVPGSDWSGRVSLRWQESNPSLDKDVEQRFAATARVRALPETRVTLSGCSYRIVPIELSVADGPVTLMQRRAIHFPDLGLSVVTLVGPDEITGGQVRQGITALARAP